MNAGLRESPGRIDWRFTWVTLYYTPSSRVKPYLWRNNAVFSHPYWNRIVALWVANQHLLHLEETCAAFDFAWRGGLLSKWLEFPPKMRRL